MNRLLLFIYVCLCTLTVHAQHFLDDLQTTKQGQGKVVIIQSPDIDSLVNGKKRAVSATPNTDKQHSDVDPSDVAGYKDRLHDDDAKDKLTEANIDKYKVDDSTITENSLGDNRKKMMKNAVKIKGYRIQVYSGGNSRADRLKAENAGTAMKAAFPEQPVYVHFYSPSWKCRMGNFRNIEDARKILAEVKKMGYTQANIIKGTIQVQQ